MHLVLIDVQIQRHPGALTKTAERTGYHLLQLEFTHPIPQKQRFGVRHWHSSPVLPFPKSLPRVEQ